MKYHFLTTLFLILSFNSFGFNYLDSIIHDEHLLRFDTVITNYKLNDICNQSIKNCPEDSLKSTLIPRLNNFIAWMIIRNRSVSNIFTQLDKRIESLFPDKKMSFSSPVIKPTGDSLSPIKLTAYVKASCSLCKRVVIPMYLAVNNDLLKGKVKLEIRPVLNSPGNRALLAAEKQGKGWEYFLALEDVEVKLDGNIIKEIAVKINLNIEKFVNDYNSPQITNELNNIHNEAIKNGFKVSPTLYINNYRYHSYKDPQWLIDALEYQYELWEKKQ